MLHVYWFILFFGMLKSFIVTGKPEDLQNKVGSGSKIDITVCADKTD